MFITQITRTLLVSLIYLALEYYERARTQVQFLTRESRRHGQVQEQRLRQTSISNLNVFDWYDGWYDS